MRRVLAIAAAAALSACGQPRQLFVDHAWVRLGAVPGRPAAAYFTLHGGPADATLIAVSTDVAVKAEMHRSMAAGGVETMAPLASAAVPAATELAIAPGGRHAMLFDVNPGIKPGATITLTFTFADGERIQQDAAVVAAGDPAPK